MEKSSVTFYSDDLATVQKYMTPTIFVMKHDTMVFVANPTVRVQGQPFVALFKHYDSTDEAYAKWLYLVGKMSKKSANSKYFLNHKLEEHFHNGDTATDEWKTIISKLIDEAWKAVVYG